MLNHKLVLLAGLFLAGNLMIAADQAAAASSGDTGPFRRSRRSGEMRERMEAMQKQLKEKYPAEWAAIEKLRETDRREAMHKTMELARKAGIEMPFGRHHMRPRPESEDQGSREWKKLFDQLKEKYPAEWAAIEKKMTLSPQSAAKDLQALAAKAGLKLPEGDMPPLPQAEPAFNRNRNRLMVKRANRILKERYPQEYAELEKLRDTDDDAAREKFRAMAKKADLTPAVLLAEPIEPAPNVSYSDKDIEAQDPSAVGSSRNWGNRGMGGWRGGMGGMDGMGGWRGGPPPRPGF